MDKDVDISSQLLGTSPASGSPLQRAHSFREQRKNVKVPLHEDSDTIRRKGRLRAQSGDRKEIRAPGPGGD